jgi:hypothetical protein
MDVVRGPFEKFVDWRQCAAVMPPKMKPIAKSVYVNFCLINFLCITAAHCRQSTNFSNGPRSCSAILKRVLLKRP